jgi:hypothetical protein
MISGYVLVMVRKVPNILAPFRGGGHPPGRIDRERISREENLSDVEEVDHGGSVMVNSAWC